MVSYHSETKRLTRSCFVCYGSNLHYPSLLSKTRRRFPATVFSVCFKLSTNPRISEDIVNLVGELVGTAAVTLLSNGELEKNVRVQFIERSVLGRI